MLTQLRQQVADGRMLALVEAFLTAGIMEATGVRDVITGVPQGAVLSPLLSNIYLDPLDQLMAGPGDAGATRGAARPRGPGGAVPGGE